MVSKCYYDLRSEAGLWEFIGNAVDAAIGGLKMHRAAVSRRPFAEIDVEDLYTVLLDLHDRDRSFLAPFVGTWSHHVQLAEAPPESAAIEHAVSMLEDDVHRMAVELEGRRRSPLGPANFDAFRRALSDAFRLATRRDAQNFKVAANQILGRLIIYAWIRDPAAVSYLFPLIRSAAESPLWIASLNYDNAIELAASACGIACDAGVAKGRPGVEFDAGSPICLAKLHGSVTWNLTGDSKVAIQDKPRGNVALIFGAGNKLRIEGPYLDLLLAFRAQLASVRHLEVCGYSFRDAHINYMLRVWLLRAPEARITAFDPHLTFDLVVDNIDSTLEDGAKINRKWLAERVSIQKESAEEWAARPAA
jgi:hypothetical protein